jgi:16S rRNA (cytosine967-C5)-methyltransferase
LWRLLKRDGKLLYVSCSVFSEENQDQITAFRTRHPDARLLPVSLESARDGSLVPAPRCDGFFYALLTKN